MADARIDLLVDEEDLIVLDEALSNLAFHYLIDHYDKGGPDRQELVDRTMDLRDRCAGRLDTLSIRETGRPFAM